MAIENGFITKHFTFGSQLVVHAIKDGDQERAKIAQRTFLANTPLGVLEVALGMPPLEMLVLHKTSDDNLGDNQRFLLSNISEVQ